MITLHDAFCEDFKNNGIGILRDCTSAEVNETINGELSLQIKYKSSILLLMFVISICNFSISVSI